MNGLNHNALTCSAVPIPPWERSLQTVEAQPYFNVSQASLVLEGIVFDLTRFSCFNDVMQSLHGLFNRRGVVKAMNLKEIHIIHA